MWTVAVVSDWCAWKKLEDSGRSARHGCGEELKRSSDAGILRGSLPGFVGTIPLGAMPGNTDVNNWS